MSTLKRFFKDTLIYGLAAVLPKAINVFLVKLKTTIFNAENYSTDINFYVYAAYFNVLLTYGMETAFFRFFTKEKEKGKIISTTFISLVITTLLFLVITLLFSNTLSSLVGFANPLHFKLLIFTLVLDTLVVVPFAYLRVTNRPIKFTFLKVSNVIVSALLTVFFIWAVPSYKIVLPAFFIHLFGKAPQVVYIFLAGVIASLSTLLLLIPTLLKFKLIFDKIIFKKLLRYALPIMIAGIAYVTNENLDKILIKKMLGDTSNGIYAACYKLSVFMTLFVLAFRLGAEPFFFNQSDKKNAKETYAIILNWFTIFGGFILFIIVAYIHLFSKIILGKEEFYQALHIVPILLLANLFLGIYHNLAIWYKLTDKTKYGMYFSIIGALITVVLNLLLIQKYGYIVSAWITLGVYFTMTLLSYFYSRKHYAIPYNIKKVSFYIILPSVLAAISYLKFEKNYYISTTLLILFIIIVYFKEQKSIKNFIN
ncbi:MAG: polysaccharide biosynthesis C-terminal domain-containing protein [Flavobacteriaceae bacterium]|nr:polysaccharide biosynthesis C-terminal domain-containing protein [Flavobacteriaceae bacterium]